MAIWDFDTFETDDLERILEMKDELDEMGLNLFDDDMIAAIHMELSDREDEEDEEEDGGCTCE
jgi:hypothetical protein